jgi:SAM-dependent methyltransferase
MHPADVERIVERYNARLRVHGDDIRTLASGTEERRRLRFDILTGIGVASGMSVVDIGCGFGDYFGYLRDRGIAVDYLGLDINADLIEVARAKYPGAAFRVADVQRDPLPACDVVVSTSAFNLPLEHQDNYEFAADILRVAYGAARHGVAIDFLTSHVDYRSPHGFHYDPARVFDAAKRLTKRVTLRHDYPLFEFCVYLYPDFHGWGGAR